MCLFCSQGTVVFLLWWQNEVGRPQQSISVCECRKHQSCNKKHRVEMLIGKDTWFEQSKLTLEEILQYLSKANCPWTWTAQSGVDWDSFCREVCKVTYSERIGSQGKTVQINGSKFDGKGEKEKKMQGERNHANSMCCTVDTSTKSWLLLQGPVGHYRSSQSLSLQGEGPVVSHRSFKHGMCSNKQRVSVGDRQRKPCFYWLHILFSGSWQGTSRMKQCLLTERRH